MEQYSNVQNLCRIRAAADAFCYIGSFCATRKASYSRENSSTVIRESIYKEVLLDLTHYEKQEELDILKFQCRSPK